MKRSLIIFLAMVLVAAELPPDEAIEKEREKLQQPGRVQVGLPGRDEAIKKEREKFQGTWIFISEKLLLLRNTPSPIDFTILEITSDTIRFSRMAPEVKLRLIPTGETRFTLDPAKDPKTIDLTSTTGENKGKTLRGIYQFIGAKLQICVADKPDGPRPIKLVSSSETDLWFLGRTSPEALKKLFETMEDELERSTRPVSRMAGPIDPQDADDNADPFAGTRAETKKAEAHVPAERAADSNSSISSIQSLIVWCVVASTVGLVLGAILWWYRRGDRAIDSRLAAVRYGQFDLPQSAPSPEVQCEKRASEGEPADPGSC